LALGATVYNFDIDLADSDRDVYETLAFRAARHPSESDEYLIARVLAYCLEYAEGIAFSPGGLSDPDEPPLAVRDLTGALVAWIDIGTPDAARLHRASKAAPRVAVYVHKDTAQWLRSLAGARVHRAEAVEVYAFDRAFVAALCARLDRRVALTLSVSGGDLYAAFADATLTAPLARLSLP
jgi:uncharacterized protein YaeQ